MCTYTGAERERQMDASPIRLIKWAQGQSLKAAIQQQPECNLYKSVLFRSTLDDFCGTACSIRSTPQYRSMLQRALLCC